MSELQDRIDLQNEIITYLMPRDWPRVAMVGYIVGYTGWEKDSYATQQLVDYIERKQMDVPIAPSRAKKEVNKDDQ